MKDYLLVAIILGLLAVGIASPAYSWQGTDGIWMRTDLNCHPWGYQCISFCFENTEVELPDGRANVWTDCEWGENYIARTQTDTGVDVICFPGASFPTADCQIIPATQLQWEVP